MTKNTIGGKGAKKCKSNRVRKEKPIVLTENTVYGEADKILGGNNVSVRLPDNKMCQALFRSAIHKKQWIVKGSLLQLEYDASGNVHEIVRVIKNTDRDYSDAVKLLNVDEENGFTLDGNESSNNDDEILSNPSANANSNKLAGDKIKIGNKEIDFDDI